jgi:hypothetical protein
MKNHQWIRGLFLALSFAIAPTSWAETDALLTVRFLDNQGQPSTGQVAVTATSRDAVQGVFDDLLAAGFRFEKVAPMGSGPQSLDAALQAHQTFAFTALDAPGIYALMINPRSNPVLSRNPTLPAPTRQASHQGASHSLIQVPAAHSHPAPEVLPFDAVFALNSQRSPLPGRITPAVEALFLKHGFVRHTGQADRAYMGLFVLPDQKSAATQATPPTARTEAPPPAPVVMPLSEAMKTALVQSGTWKDGCPVPLERLNVVEFSYRNTDGNTFRGSVVAADILGPSLARIVQAMYALGFPLEHPASAGDPKDPLHFGGTGAFNCRPITGGGGYSLHSYGTAIDINFGINPYIGGYTVDASQHRSHATEVVPGDADLRLFVRAAQPPAHSGYAEAIKDLMHQNGYIVWGGDWSNRTDYMHFQTTAFLSFLFPYLDQATGKGLLQLSVKYPAEFHRLDPDIYVTDLKKWVLLQQLYPDRFLSAFERNLPRFTSAMNPDDFLLLMDKDLSTGLKP